MMKKISYCICALLFILCTGCPGSEFNPNRKNIICLIDFSGSIPKKKMRDYADGIRDILKSMGPEDKLVVYPIDAGSLMDRVAMIHEDFHNADRYSGTTFKNLSMPDSVGPPFKRKGEDDFTAYNKMSSRISQYLEFIYPKIQPRLDSIRTDREKYSSQSDIFSAIYSVKNDLVLDGDSSLVSFANKKTTNVLIIFSDMVQSSDQFNFENNSIKQKDYSNIIDSLKVDGLVPDLHRTQVVLCDNYSDIKKAQTSLTKKRIIDFWQIYFSDSVINVSPKIEYLNSGNMDELVNILKKN